VQKVWVFLAVAVEDLMEFESGEGAWTREGEKTFMKVVADPVSVYKLKHFKKIVLQCSYLCLRKYSPIFLSTTCLIMPFYFSRFLFCSLFCDPTNDSLIDLINKLLVVSFSLLLQRSLVAIVDLSLSLPGSILQPLNPNHGTELPASKLAMVNDREAISCLSSGRHFSSP
jgi:hypothetical protein